MANPNRRESDDFSTQLTDFSTQSTDFSTCEASVYSCVPETSVDSWVPGTLVDSWLLETPTDSWVLETPTDSFVTETPRDSWIPVTQADSWVHETPTLPCNCVVAGVTENMGKYLEFLDTYNPVVVPETPSPFGDGDVAGTPAPDPATELSDSDRKYLEHLAIYCPSVATLLLCVAALFLSAAMPTAMSCRLCFGQPQTFLLPPFALHIEAYLDGCFGEGTEQVCSSLSWLNTSLVLISP